MAVLADAIRRDTRANQPAATIVSPGTLYYVTDESVTERSNGTTWDDCTDAGTGSVVTSGTFTPAVAFGGGTTGNVYSYQIGRYERIGNTVRASINFHLTTKGSSTGNATIEGLPFAAKNTTNYGQAFTPAYFTGANTGQNIAFLDPNTTNLRLYKNGAAAITNSDWSSGNDFIMTLVYECEP